ncbi:MAG: putative quinol monooxygenase [Ensifer adhaerens]
MITHSPERLISLAILTAQPGKRDALRDGLLALIEPTRREPGCLDYVLFEMQEEPGTFYMREAFTDRAALDAHFQTPHFQAFAAAIEDLLVRPLQLVFLNQISS